MGGLIYGKYELITNLTIRFKKKYWIQGYKEEFLLKILNIHVVYIMLTLCDTGRLTSM